MDPDAPRQVFEVDDTPIHFYFDASVLPGQRVELQRRITRRGGLTVQELEDAHTVIVNEERVDITKRLLRYAHSDDENIRRLCVEGLSFVSVCIRRKYFMNTLPRVQRLGGRSSNKPRVEFSPEDDERLIRHLASRIPKEFKGGRSGNRIYKELVALADNADFAWVRRHTYQSWRNRYVKNKEEFDEHIARFLDYNNVNPQIEYPYDVRLQRHHLAEEDEESSGHESNVGEDEDNVDQLIDDTPPRDRLSAKRPRGPAVVAPDKRQRVSNVGAQSGIGRNAAQIEQKGKHRPVVLSSPVEGEDEEHFNDFEALQYDEVEAGPSGTQHTPPLQRSSSVLAPTFPQSSQATLIGTQAAQRVTTKPTSRPQPKPAYRPTQRPVEVPVVEIPHLNPEGSAAKRAAARKTVLPAKPVSTGNESTLRSGAVRVTRSMSREPPTTVNVTVRTRGKGKGKEKALLPPVDEGEPNEDVEVGRGMALDMPMGETLEEQAVVDELFNEEASGADLGDEHALPTITIQRGESELDSDDQETRDALQSSPARDGEFGLDTDEDDGQPISTSAAKASRSSNAKPSSSNSQKNASGRRVEPRNPLGLDSAASTITPPFPSPGTRAREVREKLREREKKKPFTPGPTTRAAKFKKAK